MVQTKVMKRDVAIDLVKVIATLLVLNSHMGICYGSYAALATGGGIGDALFFFVSGYTLFLGRKLDFINWYKRRIGRIYPTVIAVGLLACLIYGQELSFVDVMGVRKYWFLQCILVAYIFLFPIWKYEWNLYKCLAISILIFTCSYFVFFDFNGNLFYGVDNFFRWIYYFSFMILGG